MMLRAKKFWAGLALGLRMKFLLAALAAQTMVLGVSALNTKALVAQKVAVAADRGGKNYAFLLNATLSSYASAGKLDEMGSFMTETLRDKDSTLTYVAVFDSKGRRLMSAGAAPAALPPAAPNPETQDIEPLSKSMEGSVLKASFPLLLRDGEVGRGAFGLRMSEYEDLRTTLVLRELAAGAAGLLLSVLLVHILTRGMQKRIDVLAKASKDVADGTFDKPIVMSGEDELASLAMAFESMRANLAAKIEDLRLAREVAQQSEERFRRLFDLAPVAMLMVTQSPGVGAEAGRPVVELANRSFVELFGAQKDEAIAWAGEATHWPEMVGKPLPMALKSKDGKALWVDAAAAEIDFGDEGTSWALSFVDNTDKQKAAEELASLNESLEARVKERSSALMLSNQELSSALDALRMAQDQLVASEKLASLGALVAGVAHEMSTPIGNALLTSSALQEQTMKFQKNELSGTALKRSTLQEQANRTIEACRIIGQSLESASDLLKSFKQVAVDRKSEARRKFDLEAVSRDTLAGFESSLKKASACAPIIEIEAGLMIDGYPGALSQALSNFVANAILHAFEGREGGQITVRGHKDPSDDAMVIFEFEDDGNGMDESARKRIFDPFFTTKMGKGGSGMGMNISHTLVTGVMGGTIVVRSEAGRGSKIILRLPIVSPSRSQA